MRKKQNKLIKVLELEHLELLQLEVLLLDLVLPQNLVRHYRKPQLEVPLPLDLQQKPDLQNLARKNKVLPKDLQDLEPQQQGLLLAEHP